MPVEFACPHCGNKTMVDERFAGQQGPCSRCAKTIQVPQELANQPGQAATKSVAMLVAVVLLALLTVLGGSVAFVVFWYRSTVQSQTVPPKMARMQMVGLALRQYHQKYRVLPPAYTTDESGMPEHSWRALVLSFTVDASLVEHYDYSARWDAPENKNIRTAGTRVWTAPDVSSLDPSHTSYVLLTGPGTAFDGNKSISLNDFSNQHKVVFAIEVVDSGIPWTEPRDLPVDQVEEMLLSGKIASDNGLIRVLMADGVVDQITISEATERLSEMALITKSESTKPPVSTP